MKTLPGPIDPEHERRFPLPDSLRPAYEFWKRIYGELRNDQAVLHRDRSYGIRTGANGQIEVFDGDSEYVVRYDNFAARRKGGEAGNGEYWRMQRGQLDRLEPAFDFWLRYRFHFDAAFEGEGVVPEASALGFIESMFRPESLSRTGAVGVFQIQPWEGHRLGARMDAAYHDLRDPVRAARLAAHKLSTDRAALERRARDRKIPVDPEALWPLAVLSYNQGVNSMARALDTLETAEVAAVVEQHQGRSFGFAGRNFYVQFRLFVDLARAARAAGCQADDSHPETATLTPESYIDLADLASCCGVDRTTLEMLNPGLTEAARRNLVRLPPGLPLAVPAADFDSIEAAFQDPKRGPGRHDAQVAFAGYRVRRGQTLTAIADLTRAPLFAILDANGLDLDRANRIAAGAVIRIPTARYAELVRRSAAFKPKPAAFDLHRVRSGETVRAIEKRHGLAAGELKKWNDLPDPLPSGTILSIPIYP